MPNRADALRRWWGAFCLAIAAGMLIWGQTVLQPHLRGGAFLVYWFLCFAFTFGAIVIALLDLRALRQRTQMAHRQLIQRTMNELVCRENDHPVTRHE